MRPTLSPALAALVFTSFTAANIAAQDPARSAGPNGTPRKSAKEAAQSALPVATSLPTDMLPVPGGTFTIGADPKTIIEAMEKAFLAEERRLTEITKYYAELGAKPVTVAPFFMSRYPVTNAQYRIFVEKTGHRFPYHWWFQGCPEDVA